MSVAEEQGLAGHNKPDRAVAIPRKEKNPMTSVIVVRMIDEDCAGS